jgi:hypothetical protein
MARIGSAPCPAILSAPIDWLDSGQLAIAAYPKIFRTNYFICFDRSAKT